MYGTSQNYNGSVQSLNNTISIKMVEFFFSFTLRLTMHSQVNKFVVKAFFGKGKNKKA